MTPRPNLEAMTDDELRDERKRLNDMIDDPVDYPNTYVGLKAFYDRLARIQELLAMGGKDHEATYYPPEA